MCAWLVKLIRVVLVRRDLGGRDRHSLRHRESLSPVRNLHAATVLDLPFLIFLFDSNL